MNAKKRKRNHIIRRVYSESNVEESRPPKQCEDITVEVDVEMIKKHMEANGWPSVSTMLEKCPYCQGDNVRLFKYGPIVGVKRMRCNSDKSCRKWIGDVIGQCSPPLADSVTPTADLLPVTSGSILDSVNESETVKPTKGKKRSVVRVSSESKFSRLVPDNLSNTCSSEPTSDSAQNSVNNCETQTESTELGNAISSMGFSDEKNFKKTGPNFSCALNKRLKMAQVLLNQSRQYCVDVERQRDEAVSQLRSLRPLVVNFKGEYASMRRRLQEDQDILCTEYKTYVKEVVRAMEKAKKVFDVEKERLDKMFKHVEKKVVDLKAQLDCKKEQLRQSQHETAMETRRCDVLTRDIHLARSEVEKTRRNMNDKLFLGSNQKCGSCRGNERVREVLTTQIAQKANDFEMMRNQRDEMAKKCEEKDRINQILSKDNQRLKFELSALKEDNRRMFDNARKVRESPYECNGELKSPNGSVASSEKTASQSLSSSTQTESQQSEFVAPASIKIEKTDDIGESTECKGPQVPSETTPTTKVENRAWYSFKLGRLNRTRFSG